jgi:hypothetical protein
LLNSNLAPVQLGQAITKEPGEFGPYLLWLLPQQVLPNDRRAANRTLLKAAGEVEAALRAGRLPGRTAWYPLDPNWRVWLPELPRSFAMRLREGTSCLPPGEPWGTYKGAFVQHTFDNGATRRTANTHTNRFLLEGVLFGSPGVIDSVAVADDNGRWLGATSVAASNWWEHGQAFDMRVPAPDEASGCRVVFLKNGQPQHSARLELKPVQAGTDQGFSRMAELRGLRVPLPQSSDIFGFYLHVGITHSVRAERRAAWERMLGAYYPQALNGGLVLALLAVLISSKAPAYGIGAQGCSGRPEAKPSQASMGRLLLCGFLLVSVWLVARAAFYGLVEANMGWGVVRYMRCVSPLFILVLFLAASWAGSCLGFIWLYFVRCRTKIVCPYNQFC